MMLTVDETLKDQEMPSTVKLETRGSACHSCLFLVIHIRSSSQRSWRRICANNPTNVHDSISLISTNDCPFLRMPAPSNAGTRWAGSATKLRRLNMIPIWLGPFRKWSMHRKSFVLARGIGCWRRSQLCNGFQHICRNGLLEMQLRGYLLDCFLFLKLLRTRHWLACRFRQHFFPVGCRVWFTP